MSAISIISVIEKARAEAYEALKYHIKGLMWVDDVTVDTHLELFSKDYLEYFWSHLVSVCTILRPLAEGGICATPEEVSANITGKESATYTAGSVRIDLPHSTFFLKKYGERLSCGPHYPGNTVLNMTEDDIVQLIAAYDREAIQCGSVTSRAICVCNTETDE